MSDTPRTDSYVYKFPGCQREPRLIDFARKLERELAEARAELERLKRSWDSWALKMWLNIGEKESDYPCTTKAIARLEKDMERKGKLIGQMRDALKLALLFIPENATDAIRLSEAALSAAERGE